MCYSVIENLFLGFRKYKKDFVILSHSHIWTLYYMVSGDWHKMKNPHWKCQQRSENELGSMANYSACLKSDNQFSGVCWLMKPWRTGKMLTVIPHADGREPLDVSSVRFTFCAIFCGWLWLLSDSLCFLIFFCSVLFLVCGWSHF